MIPRKAREGNKGNGSNGKLKRLLRLAAEPLPPAVEQTDDLLAVKCNLAPERLQSERRQAPGLQLRGELSYGRAAARRPGSYFAEIKNIEGLIFKGPTQAIARHTSHKDAGKRFMHARDHYHAGLDRADGWG